MKTVTAKELKNKTGDVIKSIKQGEEVMVSYRGKPLGKFVPIKKISILLELSGIIKNIPDDIKQIRSDRLKNNYEDVY